MSQHEGNPKPPSVDRLSLLWRRINDHKMVQWSVAYIALAYGVQHGVILTSESFEWPNAVARVSMLLLVLGLPMVITFAWYHGARASRNFSQAELSILAALLVMSSLLFYLFVRPSQEIATGPKAAVQQVSGVAGTVSPAGISIAVLPFLNLSRDPDQEFFSDGMTEEITSALAKVAGLNVVARTSAFQFKGENRDVQSIAQTLHVTHIIEGSVRKDGNEVRITAQLIRADNGTHLWTESYNRELKGVFAMQEEIATAIASALRVPLGLKDGQSLVSNRTTDTDSYQDYLRANALVRTRGPLEPGGPLSAAAKLLEQVVARDPNYAPAWGLLGQAYSLAPIFTAASANGSTNEFRLIATESYSKAEAAAQQAIRLDPNTVDGYKVLGLLREYRGALVQAEDMFTRALSLDPNNPDALQQYSGMLGTVGRLKDALQMRLRLQAQEPLVPIFNQTTALILSSTGRNDEALAILKASPQALFARMYLAQVYASMGRYSDAADALGEIPSGMVRPEAMEEAQRLLRIAPARASSPQTVLSNGLLGFVYLYAGVPDRVLDYYERFAEIGYPVPVNGMLSAIWTATYAPVRKTDRFKTYVRKAGMVEYWRAKGWPEFCHPLGAGDFECN
jgi:TolB-like protein/Flp pilus assembly protein TadD